MRVYGLSICFESPGEDHTGMAGHRYNRSGVPSPWVRSLLVGERASAASGHGQTAAEAQARSRHTGLIFALVTTAFWGVWGAFAGRPADNGFPETLVYVVWSLTMIPPALYALARVGWKLEHDGRSILYGSLIGLLGAGGQMLLFHAVRTGLTYLIFPLIALSPIVTIALSIAWLRERVSWIGGLGIVLALASLMGIALIPVALYMTDFAHPINYGLRGPWLAAVTQILNAVGALTLVYAFRYGKAMVVSPLTNAGAPLITALIALALLGIVPQPVKILGIVLAFAAATLLAIEPEERT